MKRLYDPTVPKPEASPVMKPSMRLLRKTIICGALLSIELIWDLALGRKPQHAVMVIGSQDSNFQSG